MGNARFEILRHASCNAPSAGARGLEWIDIQGLAIADHKYHKHLSDRYIQRLEYVEEVASKAEPVFDTDEQMQAKAELAMRNIAVMRRMQFGR